MPLFFIMRYTARYIVILSNLFAIRTTPAGYEFTSSGILCTNHINCSDQLCVNLDTGELIPGGILAVCFSYHSYLGGGDWYHGLAYLYSSRSRPLVHNLRTCLVSGLEICWLWERLFCLDSSVILFAIAFRGLCNLNYCTPDPERTYFSYY